MTEIFIDGGAGTTGLRICERLAERKDLHVITLEGDLRKDPNARRDAIARADIAILCLPDAAAIEAVALAKDTSTALIDTSTAHRTNNAFTYGFPELKGQRELIRSSKRIANPGCHASGFIALVRPLVECGLLSPEAKLSAWSLTGYSGGGKKMIADYEAQDRPDALASPAMYGLSQKHKHLPEMSAVCHLKHAPIFAPIVAPYYSGMQVSIPLHAEELFGTRERVIELYRDYYAGEKLVCYKDESDTSFLYASDLSMRDDMEITVTGNDERIILNARFDNLGKGASGAAIQNMNILLGVPEETGLVLGK